jgi:hypothetical protein
MPGPSPTRPCRQCGRPPHRLGLSPKAARRPHRPRRRKPQGPTEISPCLAELRTDNVEAQAVPAPPASSDVCGVADPVRVTSIGLADGAKIDLPDRPIHDCPCAIVFSGFVRDLMARLATAALGSRVSAISTGPAI